jgi:DNA topoisomerase IB
MLTNAGIEKRRVERMSELDELFELVRRKRNTLALSIKMYRAWMGELQASQTTLLRVEREAQQAIKGRV